MDNETSPPDPAVEHPDCPLCGQPSERWRQQHGFWIRDCTACGHRFAELRTNHDHPAAVYGDDYFTGGGAGYPNYLAEADLLRQQGWRYAELMERHRATGTMLDVGSAAGFILQGFLDRGWRGHGIEPNPSMVRYAQQTLGVPVNVGTLEDSPEADGAFDLVTMIQVAAHFFDVKQAFAAAVRQTKPGGYWLIETWNCKSWTARILRTRWHEYSPPSVLHWFNPDNLSRFAAVQGFEEVERGHPAKFISGAHAKSLLRFKLHDRPAGKLFVKVLDLLPDHWRIRYPAEDLFWILLKKR